MPANFYLNVESKRNCITCYNSTKVLIDLPSIELVYTIMENQHPIHLKGCVKVPQMTFHLSLKRFATIALYI